MLIKKNWVFSFQQTSVWEVANTVMAVCLKLNRFTETPSVSQTVNPLNLIRFVSGQESAVDLHVPYIVKMQRSTI